MKLSLKNKHKYLDKIMNNKKSEKNNMYDANKLRNASERFSSKNKSWNEKIDEAKEQAHKEFLTENKSKPETKTETKINTAPTITPADQMFVWDYCNDVMVGVWDPAKLEKINTWFIAGNGQWLIQKNKGGFFGIKKSDEGIPTLPKATLSNAFISMKYGRIPNSILLQIIAFFRAVMAKHSGSEAFCQVYWDLQESKYIVHVPKQTVSGASVRYDKTLDLNKTSPDRYIFVYECHSHNNMGAFWSGTDDADENDLRLYGVFGRLGKEDYEYKHRAIVGEEEVDVPIELIFNIESEEPEYTVMLNNEATIVKQSAITVDDQPRYMVTVGEETIVVPKESIRKIEKVPTYPIGWLDEVNTPAAREHVGSVYGNHKNTGYRSTYERNHLMPSGEIEERVEEPTSFLDDEQESRMRKAIDVLEDETNAFEDVGSCLFMHEYLERRGLLSALKNSILAYLGEFNYELDADGSHDQSSSEWNDGISGSDDVPSYGEKLWSGDDWGHAHSHNDAAGASGYWP